MTLSVINLTDRPTDRALCPTHGANIAQPEPCRGCGLANQFRKTPEYQMQMKEQRRIEAARTRDELRAEKGLEPLALHEFVDDGIDGLSCVECTLPRVHDSHLKPAAAAAAVPAQPGRDSAPDEAPAYFLRAAPRAVLPSSMSGTLLGRMAAAIEAEWGVPSLMSAMVGLGVACAATRGRQQFEIGSGEKFPVALYLAPLSPPGSMKSAVLSLMKAPLAAQQRDLSKDLEVQRQKLEAYQAAAQAKKAALAKAAAENRSQEDRGRLETDLRTLNTAATDLRRLLAAGTTVVFGGDLTAEALAARAAANLGPVAVLSAEGGLIENLAGRYNDGAANTEFVNSAYDCEEYTRERIGSGSQQIERPWVSLLLVVQPDLLATILGSPHMRRRGFMQRIWFASVPHAPYRTRHTLGAVSELLLSEWADRVGGLWDREPGTLVLPASAATPLNDFDDQVLVPRIEAATESGDELMIGWLAKAGMTAKRLAAAMQLVEDPGATVIRAPIARAAADLAALLVEHNEHLFTGSVQMVESSPRSRVLSHLAECLGKYRQNRQNPTPSEIDGGVASGEGGSVVRVAGLIEVLSGAPEGQIHAQNQGSVGSVGIVGPYASTRDLHYRFQDQKSWCGGSGDVRAVLQDLAAMGWVDDPVKVTSKKGGRPAELWRLHPELDHHWRKMMGA
jgi:hypothetical protein